MEALRRLCLKTQRRIESERPPRPVDHRSLIIAAEHGFAHRVDSLLTEGAHVNVRDFDGETALHKAARYDYINCLWVLIKAGADVNVKNSKGETPLAIAAYFDSVMSMFLLIKEGANVNKCCVRGFTPLWLASYKRNKECIRMLLKAGADVNMADKDGNTPLLCTVYNGLVKETDMLIRAGADVNACDHSGYTVLTTAVSSHSLECVRILLNAGAHVNKCNINQQNAVIFYVTECATLREEMVMLLLAAGEVLNLATLRLHSSSTVKLEMKSAIRVSIPDYFHHCSLRLCLKHACRETIRNHMLRVQPHTNLFTRVSRLSLPSSLKAYLLYDQSVQGRAGEDEDDNDNESIQYG